MKTIEERLNEQLSEMERQIKALTTENAALERQIAIICQQREADQDALIAERSQVREAMTKLEIETRSSKETVQRFREYIERMKHEIREAIKWEP